MSNMFFSLTAVFTFVIASTPSYATTKRAKQVFQLCTSCHGYQGEGRQDIEAPSIAGMQEWYILAQLKKFASGARGTHYKDDGGIRMRPMAKTLTESDYVAVSKYVAEMPKVDNKRTFEGNLFKGKTLYATCAACHGQDGRGIRATNAPAIVFMDDWYLLKQLKHFKHRIRGYDPVKDPIGMTMYPMAAGLKDDQEMMDVISYAKALQ